MFTMKRAEVSPTGEVSDLARTICGIPKPDRRDKATVYTSQADYARRLDSGNNAK
jgi:4-hydroxyphenylacetate 3-monooxygenase